MSGERIPFKDHPITPERAIINSIVIAKSDRLILQLLHTWLMDHNDIVHVEALRNFMKQMEFCGEAVLASLLSLHQRPKVRKRTKKSKVRPNELNHGLHKMIDFAAKIGQVPFDRHFKKFGLSVSQLASSLIKR